jgi:hypothetical protein
MDKANVEEENEMTRKNRRSWSSDVKLTSFI